MPCLFASLSYCPGAGEDVAVPQLPPVSVSALGQSHVTQMQPLKQVHSTPISEALLPEEDMYFPYSVLLVYKQDPESCFTVSSQYNYLLFVN